MNPQFQEARQVAFEAVVALLTRLASQSCSQQILCEQSCKDSIFRKPTSEYIVPTAKQRPYAEAFLHGEELGCKAFIEGKAESYCDTLCEFRYPECLITMINNPALVLFIKLSRVFHRVGIDTFEIWKRLLKLKSLFH